MKTLRVLLLVALGSISGCVRRNAAPPPTPPPPPPPPAAAGDTTPVGNGAVSGTVTDPSGAVVPGANVTVYSAGLQRSVKTNGSGQYAFSGLPWGTYSILISSSGFTVQKITGVVASPDSAAQTNVVLSLGSESTTVSVGGPVEHPVTIEGFPVNPPLASAWVTLTQLVGASAHPALGDYDRTLSKALDQVGYGTKGYYSYPDGFALATRIEQIYPDGRSMPLPARFSMLPPVPKLFSVGYLKGIVAPRKGYFRVIVFIVTDLPIVQSDDYATQAQAEGWPSHGATKLPSKISRTIAPDGISVTAFIYEFKNSTADDSSKLTLLDSATIQGTEPLLDAKQHLQEAGLWAALGLH